MTDEELAEYLRLTPAEFAIVLPKLSPQRRATYNRMKQIEIDLGLWEAGIGPKPQDVMVDTVRRTRRRRGWR